MSENQLQIKDIIANTFPTKFNDYFQEVMTFNNEDTCELLSTNYQDIWPEGKYYIFVTTIY